MTSYFYKKTNKNIRVFIFKFFSIFLILLGSAILLFVSLPIISWNLYFAPVFASQDLTAPIPKTTVISRKTIQTLVETASETFDRVDFTNAKNWFPTMYKNPKERETKLSQYQLSIPKLGIANAIVSTTDYDLNKHLVHYGDTALPSENGNTVIFGHSTLPQLFNPTNYKTIFANLYKLGINDEVIITVEHVSYLYKIKNILVVNPTETSVFSQNFDKPYLTLVTCTPPGTTWKRLILRGELEKI